MATRIVYVNGQETVVTETEDQVVEAVRRDHPNPVKLERFDRIVMFVQISARAPAAWSTVEQLTQHRVAHNGQVTVHRYVM